MSREEELLKALENGDLKAVKNLISSKTLEKELQDGDTPLGLASFKGHLEVVEYLVEECGADVNAKDVDGYTALICAAEGGHPEVVEFLVNSKADIEAKNDDNDTALESASRNYYFALQENSPKSVNNYVEIVRYLTEKQPAFDKFKKDLKDPIKKNDLINEFIIKIFEAKEENQEVHDLLIKIYDRMANDQETKHLGNLLENGFESKEIEKRIGNVLSFAIWEKDIDTIRFLAAKNIEITEQHLKDAENTNSTEEIKNFIKIKLYVREINESEEKKKEAHDSLIKIYDEMTNNYQKAKFLVDLFENSFESKEIEKRRDELLKKAIIDNDVSSVGFLVEKGIKVTKNHIAIATNQQKDIIKKLLQQGFKQQFGDLVEALKKGNLSKVKYLVDKETVDKKLPNVGYTALAIASFYGHLEVVRYLVEELKASIDPKNRTQLPICEAAAGGHLNIIKYFMEKGQDLNTVVDFKNISPLSYACYTGKLKTVKFLVENSNYLDKKKYAQPMIQAAKGGYFSILKYFVEEKEVSVNIKSDTNYSILDAICSIGDKKALEYIVERGATIKDSKLSIFRAIKSGNLEVVKYLVEKEGNHILSKTYLDDQRYLDI